MNAKLADEIKRLHNPTSDKTFQLFRDYAGVELAEKWCWNGMEPKAVRERLDKYLKLRGDVVHRSREASPGPPRAHQVKKEDLEKAINFLKQLVQVTEGAFQ